ncbi:MAG TPA: crossover junction endodeoxyribonuclease RuvC [Gaiellales bacterium]|nr:crossover junction endodeoxyribonuclease RuvC [Gaiellales bacterium]
MRVLGIDPGIAETGFGLVAFDGPRARALDHGVLTTPATERLEQRVAEIHVRVADLIARHAPDAVALEDLYVGGNPRTVLSVGHARGAVLSACGMAGVPATGYAPADVKMTVCGYGRADKQQVQRMVTAILGMTAPPGSDHAADALAVAVCHAQAMRAASVRGTRVLG